MFTPTYTITTEGNIITTVRDDARRAIRAAKSLAKTTGKDVVITAHLDAVTDRDVTFHPDGTNENIWIIDKGRHLEPAVGEVYANRGGGRFKCISLEETDSSPHYWNAGGGSSATAAVMQNTESGWTFTAKGIIEYADGTIEWGHSIGGHFEEVEA